MNIKIDQQVFPVTGLDTEPGTPPDELRLVGQVQPTAALLLAAGATGAVWVEATSTGELKVADTGGGLEAVDVSSGSATDTLVDLALANSFTRCHITVRNEPLNITFEITASSYSGTIRLEVGTHERNISALDMQVQNANAGLPSTYQVEAYR